MPNGLLRQPGMSLEEVVRRAAELPSQGFSGVIRRLDPGLADEFEQGSDRAKEAALSRLRQGESIDSAIEAFRRENESDIILPPDVPDERSELLKNRGQRIIEDKEREEAIRDFELETTIRPGSEVGAEVFADKGLRKQLEEGLRSAPTLASLESDFERLGVQVAQAGEFKVPSGFRLKDKDKPEKGIEVIPGKEDRTTLTPEQAGRMTQILTARKAFDDVRDLLFDKDGSLNQLNILNANLNTPKSEGRKLRVGLEQVIQAITRIETGAAMPPEEVRNTRKRFMPTPLDDQETVELKLELIDAFMNGSVKLVDPNGTLNMEAFDNELAARKVAKRIAPEADIETLRKQAEDAIAQGANRDIVERALQAIMRGRE